MVADSLHSFHPRKTYFIKEVSVRYSMEIFKLCLSNRFYGICITRTNPQIRKNDTALVTTPIFWVSKEARGDFAISPHNLEMLYILIKNFLKNFSPAVILLEGLEYIAQYRGFDSLSKLINDLVDLNSMYQSIFIISIHPAAFTEQEWALLEKLGTVLDSDTVQKKVLTTIQGEGDTEKE